MVELIISITMLGIIMATLIPFFVTTQRGYTAMEVSAVLPAATQGGLNKVQQRLVENKRIFGNDATGNAYLGRVTPSVSPAAMSGSALPVIAPNMGLTPSTGTFVAANIGNSLLFASLYEPKDATVLDGGGNSVTDRIDTYTFNYYYLSLDNTRAIAGYPIRVLREWHGVPYADYQQLMNISDATERANVAAALFADGVIYAWNTSASAVTSAFYTLTVAGAINAASGHNVQTATGRNAPQEMIKVIEGVASGGFRFSVSPNTGGGFTHKYTVPGLGVANSGTGFPSGFEAAIVGTGSARQVFLRLVMAVQGNFKGYKGYESILLVTARDLY